jgi:hypothetical protein
LEIPYKDSFEFAFKHQQKIGTKQIKEKEKSNTNNQARLFTDAMENNKQCLWGQIMQAISIFA